MMSSTCSIIVLETGNDWIDDLKGAGGEREAERKRERQRARRFDGAGYRFRHCGTILERNNEKKIRSGLSALASRSDRRKTLLADGGQTELSR